MLKKTDIGQLLMGVKALIFDDINEFPGEWNRKLCIKMINKSEIDRLAIAGSFIPAEIDRLIAKNDKSNR